MEKVKIYWGRIVAIVLILTVVDIFLHDVGQRCGLIPDFQAIHMPAYTVEPQPLHDKEWTGKVFLPFLALTFVLTFGFLATIFSFIHEKLPGTRMAKGFRYGICFWGLWAVGILEWHYIYNSSWAYDLYNTAFLDGAFLLVTSLLAARFLGTKSSPSQGEKAKAGILILPIIAILFLIGRYFNYSVFNIVSAQHVLPVQTFVCLLLVGIWIGIIYLLLEPALQGYSPLKRALWFAVIIFGTNWWFFAQFELLLMKISWTDPVLRVGIDIVMVALGIFIFEKFIRKEQAG